MDTRHLVPLTMQDLEWMGMEVLLDEGEAALDRLYEHKKIITGPAAING